MQLEAKDIILILLGILQVWFFYDKTRTDAQIKELSDGIKSMISLIHKIESDLNIAKYALFEEKRKGRNDD